MALKAGDAASDFKLSAMTGAVQGEFRLSAHRGKNVVICFYPLDFTPVCQSELAAFQGDLAKFAGANTQVMGVSTDTIFSHQAFQQALGGLSYPLLADRWPYAETAKAYGVFPPSKHTIPFVNDRAIFIVEKNGKIAWSKVYEIGQMPETQEILDALRNLG